MLQATVMRRPSQSMSRRRRSAHSSPRRIPVVAATKIALALALAFSGLREAFASSMRAITSWGSGTTGVPFGIHGGAAHCAGLESRHPQPARRPESSWMIRG